VAKGEGVERYPLTHPGEPVSIHVPSAMRLCWNIAEMIFQPYSHPDVAWKRPDGFAVWPNPPVLPNHSRVLFLPSKPNEASRTRSAKASLCARPANVLCRMIATPRRPTLPTPSCDKHHLPSPSTPTPMTCEGAPGSRFGPGKFAAQQRRDAIARERARAESEARLVARAKSVQEDPMWGWTDEQLDAYEEALWRGLPQKSVEQLELEQRQARATLLSVRGVARQAITRRRPDGTLFVEVLGYVVRK